MQLELFQRNGVKKLENKIHIYELDCYKNATEEQKKRMRVRKDRYFDLEGLPSEEVRKLLEDFVWERGKKLAPSSLASEILYFNNIRNFLIEKNIKILRYEDENKIILQLKSWMMEKGYALTSKKYRSVYEIVATETPEQKIKKAIRAIDDMSARGMPISVTELVRWTGLSRGFFYKNMQVRQRLEEAVKLPRRIDVQQPSEETNVVGYNFQELKKDFNRCQSENQRLKVENEQLLQKCSILQKEVDTLKKRLDRKEIALLKKL